MAADSTDGMRLSLDAISCIGLESELIEICCYVFLKEMCCYVSSSGPASFSTQSFQDYFYPSQHRKFLPFTTQEKREMQSVFMQYSALTLLAMSFVK
jgi:hypothetical protein